MLKKIIFLLNVIKNSLKIKQFKNNFWLLNLKVIARFVP